jgi:hypothetical protein
MAKNSRNRVVELFSLEAMIKNHEKFYESIGHRD